MPALKAWSNKRALTGQVLLEREAWKSSREGMDNTGSKPSSDIGGSLSGDPTNRIRPNRRASEKAISVKPGAELPSWMYRMNFTKRGGHISDALLAVLLYLTVTWPLTLVGNVSDRISHVARGCLVPAKHQSFQNGEQVSFRFLAVEYRNISRNELRLSPRGR